VENNRQFSRSNDASYNRVPPLPRFSLLLVISLSLMIVDHRSTLLDPFRVIASLLNIPFEIITQVPKSTISLLETYYPDSSLSQQYVDLQRKQIVLEARLQRYEALEKENQRLSKLLSASERFAEEVLLTEIVEFGLEPFNHKIVINRGIEAGVYLGQPAIAPDGVLGQVSRVGYHRSVVTLVTDPGHGLSVQIQRSGLRTIIQGAGKADHVIVPFLASQADIQQGDILVTSGMGGRFPVGYKVAEVTDIVKDANEAFLIITAQTTARIGFAKEVLLLWSDDQTRSQGFRHSGFLNE